MFKSVVNIFKRTKDIPKQVDETNDVPLHIFALSKLIKIVDYKKEYDSDELNLSTGEIKKFNFCESQRGTTKFGKSVSCSDGRWVHIADDWFKNVTKSGTGTDRIAFLRNKKLRKI